MNNETGQRLTEAIWALTNELALHRMQAEQGPSHTGAAPFTSGDTVTVTNPRSEWYGVTGTVTRAEDKIAHVQFPDNNRLWLANRHLTKGESA